MRRLKNPVDPVHFAVTSGGAVAGVFGILTFFRGGDAFGASVVGVWERGRFAPARPDLMLTDASVPIIAGKSDQLDLLVGVARPAVDVG